jgi:signal transduction histidine kinase
VITILFYFIQREKQINESQNINTLRAYTSPVVNIINEDFPSLDHGKMKTRLEELNINALVSDLESNILYNDTSFSTTDIIHDLYQDQSYSLSNKDVLKVSFPVKDDIGIAGFVIFEIPKEMIQDNSNGVILIILAIEIVLSITLTIVLIRNYKQIVIEPKRQLDEALLDVSNGVYKTLKNNKGISLKSVTNYNIMLEKLENRLSNQASYAKSRKQLIANISHEIRTPLSYVKISAEILSKDKNMGEENKKYIDTILQKITAIDGIIEDLFRYSKQDLDKLLVETKETYAKDMFERIFNSIKTKDEHKNITIITSNDIPNILMFADENRLVQVVTNMVDNAEKHIREDGLITLKTMIEENHVVLIIEDTGEGIEPKDLPYIFEPFYQGSQEEEIKKKGAGLGLSICDYIIKKHNGEIFVYSELEKGTTFVVKFQELQ